MRSINLMLVVISLCITGYEMGILEHNKMPKPQPSNPSLDDYDNSYNYYKNDKDPIKPPFTNPDLEQRALLTIEDPGLDSTGMPNDGANHPCYRNCTTDVNKKCYYKFNVEWYYSMSKACMNCPSNGTDCDLPDCVPANGIGRAITVVNRKMPGPSIQVCKGDTIVVDVKNSLMGSGTSIHWHGLHQKNTPFMDGTPFVTQCPITPESTFRYEFDTPQSGTFFWHSHIGMQRGDGTTGALIIRDPRRNKENRKCYDVDNPEHVMVISDWVNTVSINYFTNHHHYSGDNRPGALLINGRGRFQVSIGNTTSLMKAPVFKVTKGRRFRFRMINAEFLNCPVELSVDGHKIVVIASDGFDLQPIRGVAALVSYAGERYDFVIETNKPVGNYWIRVRGLLGCEAIANQTRQVALLRYKNAKDEEPRLDWNTTPKGKILNQVQHGEEQHKTMPVSAMRAQEPNTTNTTQHNTTSIEHVDDDHKFFIGFDLMLKNNTHFHRVPYYSTDKLKDEFLVYTPQLNDISMKLPQSPLLVSRPDSMGFCNEFTVPSSCQHEYCECPHVLEVKLNHVVEIILVDEGKQFNASHPFHLHGHSFRVVSQKQLGGNSTTVEAVKALDRDGKIKRNLDRAPLKDTVAVPDGGYTVIRFVANNPGYWLFHCHIEFHAEIGMGLVFKVGEHKDMKPVPPGFPQCGNYKANDYAFV